MNSTAFWPSREDPWTPGTYIPAGTKLFSLVPTDIDPTAKKIALATRTFFPQIAR
jgi:hypothetical protein